VPDSMQGPTPETRPELYMSPDVDAARRFFRDKPRRMDNKTTTVADAIARYVADGCYVAIGGFGTNRIPTALLHEILRQGRKGLGMSGHTATHDCQILAAGEAFDRVDIAYVIGLEARGLSRSARRLFESGRLRVTEWSNAALAWRYQAAAMGVPFLPARVMLGSDTGRYSAAVEITCPFTGIKLLAMPALYPDVALIHVHRADVYGNCQIDGISVSDIDVARAARRVLVTCERLVPTEEIRQDPTRTAIPYFLVDSVSEVPYGSYPGNMPYEYFSDEEHLREWLDVEEDPDRLAAFVRRHILDTPDFQSYLELCGGLERMRRLRLRELLIPETGSGQGAGVSAAAPSQGGDR
jgi:glutaconate CoA-transferase, subunit A